MFRVGGRGQFFRRYISLSAESSCIKKGWLIEIIPTETCTGLFGVVSSCLRPALSASPSAPYALASLS